VKCPRLDQRKRKREDKKKEGTSGRLIRIPARRSDKSPPPKFARILAFALLVFASRAFKRRLHPHSHSRLSFSSRSNANFPMEQLFPSVGDRFVEKEPRLSSVSVFHFLYPFISYLCL